jgi:hypothetical protein
LICQRNSVQTNLKNRWKKKRSNRNLFALAWFVREIPKRQVWGESKHFSPCVICLKKIQRDMFEQSFEEEKIKRGISEIVNIFVLAWFVRGIPNKQTWGIIERKRDQL